MRQHAAAHKAVVAQGEFLRLCKMIGYSKEQAELIAILDQYAPPPLLLAPLRKPSTVESGVPNLQLARLYVQIRIIDTS